MEDQGLSQPPANPEIEERGGVIHREATPADLAVKAEIDIAGLERTLAAIATATTSGQAKGLPESAGSTIRALKGDFSPYPSCQRSLSLWADCLPTGMLEYWIPTSVPFRGLYAAGGTASGLQGSLEGGPASSYVGGLALALVLGLLGAEAVAAAKLHPDRPAER